MCYCIKFCLTRQKNLLPILAPTEKKMATLHTKYYNAHE